MIDEYDHIEDTLKAFDMLNSKQLEVGIVNGDEFLSMVAWVNDAGATITAKNVPYLMIPYKQDGKLKFAKKKSVNIPARPFLERTINTKGFKWNSYFADLTQDMLEGHGNSETIMRSMGRLMVDDMRVQIKGYIRPHNAPLTIANKGFDDTLIDTGKLLNSIDYRIARTTI